jgi:small multidrug resistance family-3 protein
LIATTLEVSGDALVRRAIYDYRGLARIGLAVAGAALLFGYGTALNLAPVEFNRVAGLYIATLFVVWQVVSFIAFRSIPSPPLLVGGALIVAGGLVVTFWRW